MVKLFYINFNGLLNNLHLNVPTSLGSQFCLRKVIHSNLFLHTCYLGFIISKIPAEKTEITFNG